MKHFLMFSLVIFVAACSPRQEPLNIAGGTYLGYQPFFLTQEILLCDTCPQSSNFIGGRPMNLHMLPSTTTVLRLFQAEELTVYCLRWVKPLLCTNNQRRMPMWCFVVRVLTCRVHYLIFIFSIEAIEMK